MTRNGVRLRETQRFRVFLAFSLKNGNPFDRLSYIIYKRKTHRYLRTRTATHKAPQCFNNKTLPKQLITETAHTGVRYFLSPGLKSDILSGNYLSHRQQPPASTHILRTLRGYAEASACAVTQVLLYISKQALSSLFCNFFGFFRIIFSQIRFTHHSGCSQPFCKATAPGVCNVIITFSIRFCNTTVPGVFRKILFKEIVRRLPDYRFFFMFTDGTVCILFVYYNI